MAAGVGIGVVDEPGDVNVGICAGVGDCGAIGAVACEQGDAGMIVSVGVSVGCIVSACVGVKAGVVACMGFGSGVDVFFGVGIGAVVCAEAREGIGASVGGI